MRVSKIIVALTGAGVSAESGLQTFRESSASSGAGQALWSQYRPEELATPEAFERTPELVWEFYSMRRLKAGEVKPNAGHIFLAKMGQKIEHFTLITQNVDGLHQKAGSEDVIELHGNITRIKCSRGCGVFTEWEDIPGSVPNCPKCGGKLRPDVVWFGEALPRLELARALDAAQTCQVFFSIGTSGLVQPAASLPQMARQKGAFLVEINLEATPLTRFVDVFISGKSGEVLPEMFDLVWGQRLPDQTAAPG